MSSAATTLPDLQLPAALHPLVLFLLDRPDLLNQLSLHLEANRFLEAVVSLAEQHGIAVDEAALHAVLRPDPLGLGRFGPAPITLDQWPGAGWLPTRSIQTGGAPAFDWLWFGDRPLTAPFYEDDVRRAGALPLNWLLRTRTGFDALVAGADGADALPLNGLILHMSRCGSTLLTHMLGAVPGQAVSSEPEPLDAVLRWIAASGMTPQAAARPLQAMVAALGRRPGSQFQRHLIKLEVWHTLFLPELQAAFPQVPWLYLHRDPVEVLVSQVAQASIHVVPGALDEARLGIAGYDAGSQAEYSARVLGRCVQGAVDHWPTSGGLLLDYANLLVGGAVQAAAHFGVTLTPADAAAMAASTGRDAKSPNQPFSDDRAQKRAAATPELRAAAARWITPAHGALLLR